MTPAGGMPTEEAARRMEAALHARYAQQQQGVEPQPYKGGPAGLRRRRKPQGTPRQTRARGTSAA